VSNGRSGGGGRWWDRKRHQDGGGDRRRHQDGIINPFPPPSASSSSYYYYYYYNRFSLCFGETQGGFIGNPATYFLFKNVGAAPHPDFSKDIPFLLYSIFQLMFAIITVSHW